MTKLSLVPAFLVLICSGCKPIINAVAFHPDTTNVIDSYKLPTGVEEIVIQTNDNIKLKCLYLSSTTTDKLVIYFHGNAGNIYHRMTDLIQFRNSGVNVIGVSYRGYGKSGGRPSEQGVYEDGISVLNFAKNKLNYSLKNIFIFGRSIGSTVAVNTSINLKLAGSHLSNTFVDRKTTGIRLRFGIVCINCRQFIQQP
jgi:dipeptidyl aminopeptidase/acylaminoacyl peptidase